MRTAAVKSLRRYGYAHGLMANCISCGRCVFCAVGVWWVDIYYASASVKAAIMVSGDSSPTEIRSKLAGTPQSSVQSNSS